MPVYQERPGTSTLKQFLNSLKQTLQTEQPEQQRNKRKMAINWSGSYVEYLILQIMMLKTYSLKT